MVDLSVLTDEDVARELGYGRLREMALTKQLVAVKEPTRLDEYRAWKAAQAANDEGPPPA